MTQEHFKDPLVKIFTSFSADVAAASSSLLMIDDPGVGYQNDESIHHHAGFVGTLQQFTFNGNSYFEIAKQELVENIEVTARYFDTFNPFPHNDTF